MYVCLYVCMFVCMHACMYVCMYVCVYACMHTCLGRGRTSTWQVGPYEYDVIYLLLYHGFSEPESAIINACDEIIGCIIYMYVRASHLEYSSPPNFRRVFCNCTCHIRKTMLGFVCLHKECNRNSKYLMSFKSNNQYLIISIKVYSKLKMT